MKKSRAKMMVETVTEHRPTRNWDYEKKCEGDEITRRQTVKFESVYDSKIPEDLRFQEASPSAGMHITLANQALIDTFKPGQFYYVDLTPVTAD